MSDKGPQTPFSRETDRWLEPGKINVQVIYVLYLVGFAVGITPIIGVVRPSARSYSFPACRLTPHAASRFRYIQIHNAARNGRSDSGQSSSAKGGGCI